MRDKTQPPLHAGLCNINPSLSCCQVELQVLLRFYMRPHYMHIGWMWSAIPWLSVSLWSARRLTQPCIDAECPQLRCCRLRLLTLTLSLLIRLVLTAVLTHHTTINLMTKMGAGTGQQGNSMVRRGNPHILTALLTHHTTINLVTEMREGTGQQGNAW